MKKKTNTIKTKVRKKSATISKFSTQVTKRIRMNKETHLPANKSEKGKYFAE